MREYYYIFMVALLLTACMEVNAQDKKIRKERKHLVVYFTYGMPDWEAWDSCHISLRKQFGFKEKLIAGCVVSPKKIIRAKIRRFRSDFTQLFRFGFNWRTHYYAELKNCR